MDYKTVKLLESANGNEWKLMATCKVTICYKWTKKCKIIGMFFLLQFSRTFSSHWWQCAFQYHIFYPSAHVVWCFLQHNLVMQTHSHLHFWCVLLTLRLSICWIAFKYGLRLIQCHCVYICNHLCNQEKLVPDPFALRKR